MSTNYTSDNWKKSSCKGIKTISGRRTMTFTAKSIKILAKPCSKEGKSLKCNKALNICKWNYLFYLSGFQKELEEVKCRVCSEAGDCFVLCFTTSFWNKPYFSDHHLLCDCFAHIVDCKSSHLKQLTGRMMNWCKRIILGVSPQGFTSRVALIFGLHHRL